MAVEIFTKEQFEAALPMRKDGTGKAWEYAGSCGGEHTYILPLPNGLGVKIHSSVGMNGLSGDTGENSIRIYLIDLETNKPAGSKISKWTTRVAGWQNRMMDEVRALARLGIKVSKCPVCGKNKKVFKVSKVGPNCGRLFITCDTECNQFEWID